MRERERERERDTDRDRGWHGAISTRMKDVLPFSDMVAVECTNVGLNTLFKAATLKGLSYYRLYSLHKPISKYLT